MGFGCITIASHEFVSEIFGLETLDHSISLFNIFNSDVSDKSPTEPNTDSPDLFYFEGCQQRANLTSVLIALSDKFDEN